MIQPWNAYMKFLSSRSLQYDKYTEFCEGKYWHFNVGA